MPDDCSDVEANGDDIWSQVDALDHELKKLTPVRRCQTPIASYDLFRIAHARGDTLAETMIFHPWGEGRVIGKKALQLPFNQTFQFGSWKTLTITAPPLGLHQSVRDVVAVALALLTGMCRAQTIASLIEHDTCQQMHILSV